MTIDEAISIMNVIVHMLEPQYDTDRIEDAVEMAIKALEQQSTDAVSRQAAIVALDNRMQSLENVDMQIAMGFAKGIIHELPPVTPQQKMGKWKRINKEKYVQHAMSYYRCSECGKEMIGTHNYCPYCGARMESEQNE